MAAPTRAQLEADVLQPTTTVEWWNGSAWVDVSQHVVRTRVQSQLPKALDLGAGAIPTATITLSDATLSIIPAFAPVRISYGLVSTATIRRFVGYVTSISRIAPSPSAVAWNCQGVAAAIAAQTIRIPVRRNRPPHTQTTSTSIEDPNNSSYSAGMINEVLWRAGGRPLQQQAAYPTAPWYYDCTSSLLTPEWSWLDGENAWDDIARLCRAVGSIIYQDEDGVVRVRSVVHATSGSAVYGWTDQALTAAQRIAQNRGLYQTIEERRSWEDVPSAITVRYVRRGVSGVVECYNDTTARYLLPNQSLQLQLDSTEPILNLERIEIDAASTVSGTAVSIQQSGVQAVAHTITLTATNPSNEPAIITAIRAYGTVVLAIEEGTASAARTPTTITSRELRTEDNPYVQNELHARGLARLLNDLYGVARPSVTLRRCASDVDRTVGQIVSVTSSALGYTDERCVIEYTANDANSWMDVSVTPLSGLPQISDLFVVGQIVSNTTTRTLGY
jgi:hypothetical protein